MPHKILIVDDHLVVREGLKLLVGLNPEFVTAGEAENGREAVELAGELNPDVILMDLYMPVMTGLEAIKEISEKHPSIPVIILTTYNEDKLMAEGMEYGAKGYLLKDTSPENMFRTLDAAIRGDTLISSEMMTRIQSYKKEEEKQRVKPKIYLSSKEIDVLEAVARGAKSKEIAIDLKISERTVKARLTDIYNKLGVSSRAEAAALAIQTGIITLQD
ncbi:two component transcriptional regulator, LuxR family [Terribacillus aidingensis]|uniref:Two component transcriptional regulator, LuxR family n=1 Tax=Terribacillus aidingensis TaxID=586416 RepID=A0A285P2W8_9BACI|nr:response regulator transcription factor [Terribacillus aidingensis]SNZ15503.1 two component transcriptional regulator, LuxR family [Terribacillus aidingensis]